MICVFQGTDLDFVALNLIPCQTVVCIILQLDTSQLLVQNLQGKEQNGPLRRHLSFVRATSPHAFKAHGAFSRPTSKVDRVARFGVSAWPSQLLHCA
jgi:hypothetical protein